MVWKRRSRARKKGKDVAEQGGATTMNGADGMLRESIYGATDPDQKWVHAPGSWVESTRICTGRQGCDGVGGQWTRQLLFLEGESKAPGTWHLALPACHGCPLLIGSFQSSLSHRLRLKVSAAPDFACVGTCSGALRLSRCTIRHPPSLPPVHLCSRARPFA